MRALTGLVGVICLAVGFLLGIGGLVGTIWLLVIGDWRFVIGALLASIIMPMAWAIGVLLTVPFLIAGAAMFDRGWRLLASVPLAIGLFATAAMTAGWSIGVMWVACNRSGPGMTFLPYFLVANGTIMAPLAYMLAKERPPAPGSVLCTVMAQAYSYVLAIGCATGHLRGSVIVVLCGSIVHLVLALVLGFAGVGRERAMRARVLA